MSRISAMRELREKDESELTKLELAIVILWNLPNGYEHVSEHAAAELAALRGENERLRSALAKIDHITAEWDANKLGGVDLQCKRWQRCGEIAAAALAGE